MLSLLLASSSLVGSCATGSSDWTMDIEEAVPASVSIREPCVVDQWLVIEGIAPDRTDIDAFVEQVMTEDLGEFRLVSLDPVARGLEFTFYFRASPTTTD